MINILDKITNLRLERNWSEYELAEHSGLTQSTISSWYRKDMIPSITSLEKVCSAFGITLSQFFSDDNETMFFLTTEQKALLDCSSKLNSSQFNALIQLLKSL